MDSGNPNAANQTAPIVRVKVEPGTEVAGPSTAPPPIIPAIIPPISATIKTESGLPTSTTRLTSFRLPRDLTLGGNVKLEKPKKVYTPNLNVQRNKNKDEPVAVRSNTKNSRERGRGRGQGPRGRGRGKVSDNIIQTGGIFSDGIADSSRPGKKYRSSGDGSGRSSDRSTSSALEKQKLNLNHKIDKAEEEEKLKKLLRDDFIENGAVPDMENPPVMLPMADEARLYKEEVKDETPIAKIDNMEEDVKPVILENGKVSDDSSGVKAAPKKSLKEEKKLITIPQIVANETNSYILLQFPDCLPGLRTDDEMSDPKSKKAESSTQNPSDNNPKTEYCTLNNLREGMLGKLQLLKSGRARLVLGDNKLVVDVGSHISFRQDLIAAKLDMEKLTGELLNLGTVGSTLICSPDWESMLANL